MFRNYEDNSSRNSKIELVITFFLGLFLGGVVIIVLDIQVKDPIIEDENIPVVSYPTSQNTEGTVEEKVERLAVVDTSETPAVANITNAESLKKENSLFYGEAQNGDKLVVYKTKVILYRPSENKIINILPLEK